MTERMQFFIDESGKSGLTMTSGSEQPHLLLAGVLIPWESGFWDDVKPAWEIAGELLGKEPYEIELHAWELFGGRGQWDGTPNALPVLETVFEALEGHEIAVYWTGLPVPQLERKHSEPGNLWNRILFTYLELLNDIFAEAGDGPVEVYCDQSWLKPGNALTVDNWGSFTDCQAGFLDSADCHGIQIADIVAHTLYRCNKDECSNTDRKAEEFRSQIASQFIHLPS